MSRNYGPPGPQGPRNLQVRTNSFKITGLPTKSYNQYDVSFDHEKISNDRAPRRRIEVFERLQNHTAPSVFKPKIIYDGDKIAYSPNSLSFGNSATFEVNMTDRPPRPDGRGVIRVTLKRVDALPITFEDLRNLIDGRIQQLSPRAAVALNLVQLIVRQGPNLKYPNTVKTFFCREAGSKVLGGGLEVLKGFYQSVRPALRQLLVNVDTSCGAFYQAGPMPEIALSFLKSNNPRALYLDDGQQELSRLRKFFKGVMITFKHRQGVRKMISNIVPRAGSQKFEWNKDRSDNITQSTTVQAYFREAYNLTLVHPDAIGVQVGGGSIVPIEFCIVLPDQRYKNKLPAELTKPMVDFTSERPNVRLDTILRGMVGNGAALDYSSSPWVQDADIVVTPQPIIIDGKVLATPPITYKTGEVQPRSGSWNAVNQKFMEPIQIRSWAVVDYSPNFSRDQGANRRFVEMIQQSCRKLGMSMPPPGSYIRGNGSNPPQDLYRAGREASGSSGGPPDLFLVILPPSAPEIRLQVKRFGDVKEGVVTQCVRVDKISRAKDQYCNNVAMKINAKLGGINAVPKSTILEKLGKERFMIMGVDVGHPAPGVRDQPSVAALVASCDGCAVKYSAYAAVQPPRMEKVEQMDFLTYSAIDDFGGRFGPPTMVIIYRDGLSEGEYVGVAQQEIQDIREGIDKLWKRRNINQAKPKLTYIVVGKRHHVRFFPHDRDADKSGNCPAGFVADNGIGNPIAKDFYLQSHGGLLGTSRPSHYIVILDEIFGNDTQVLQELSFVLCHSYARATRSVSIPAPVYYADLVCGRANFHFDPELRFDDSSGSVSSGNPTFNIEQWRAGFSRPHRNMLGKMFYM